ncbi:MAG TPA: alpha/beta hydrolase, partial [Turneriella sp.]|nr:alpha/beta hydrolase [Turneriella sp.]
MERFILAKRFARRAFARKAVSLVFAAFFFTACGNDPSQDGFLVPKTVKDDTSLPSEMVRGTKLHLMIETKGAPGPGDNIIFLHGGPGYDYRSLILLKDKVKASLTNAKIVMYDQRGGGLSERLDPSDSSLSVASHVEDLEAIRVTKFNAPMKVIAHSFGGALLQAYIAKYPANVTNAVFISSMPPKNNKDDDLLESIFNTAAGDYTWQRNLLGESHAELDFRFINFLSAQPYYYCSENDYKKVPFWRFGYVATIKTMENGLLASPVSGPSVTYGYDFVSTNAAYTGKSAFIVGACDTKLGKPVANALSATLGGTKRAVVEVSDAGHFTFTDQLN